LQSGIYRFKLCDGWVGCSDIGEYLGFNNKSCAAGVPPNSKVYGNTVGPVLRDFEESKHWKSWNVDVLSRGKSGVEVTLENKYTGYGESRCKNHFVSDYSEKKNACKDSEWADRVHLHKDRVKWTLKEVKNTDGCFNIINDEKPDGCLRYLSAQKSCDDRYLKLVEKDDGSGLQRWKLEKVGTGTTPNVPSPDIPLPGSMCVSTGPQNCVACCQSKLKDGSFMQDSSCVDIEKYPECDFDPSLVAASGGSDGAGTVSFSPTPGATECTVIEDSVDGKSSIRTVITHLSFPVTTTHPVGLDPNTEYKIQVSCRIGGEEIKSTDTHLLETVDSSSQPGIVNLHQTSETSGSFDIVPPSASGSDCDASSYNVVATPSEGKSIKLSVTGTFVVLKNLKTSVPYEITVEAVCKDGSVSQKSPTALLKTVPSPSSSASPSPGSSASPSPGSSASPSPGSSASPSPGSSASPSPGSSASPSPSQSGLSIPAPSFHTISVFGPHPTVALMVDPGVPDGSTLNLKTECGNGFKSSLQVPASKSETKVQLNTGLPADTTCTFLASISKGSINSKEVSETRILPTSTEETPRLERWTPNYKGKSAEVTVVAPMKPNCTIKSYTVTTTVPVSSVSLVGRKLLQSPLPAPVTVTAPGPVTLSPVSYGINNPETFNLAVVGNCLDGSKTPEGHLSVTFLCPMIQSCSTYKQDGSCQCQTCDSGFTLNGNTGRCDVQQISPSPPPPPASTTGGGFVEFEGDAKVIKTGELERVDFTFTPACGDTFKESDPDGTVKCGWVRQGSTDLTASSTSIPPGDYKFTVTGSQCPPSQGQVCDWAAHLLKDNPVSATCPQTDGLVVGICRTAIDLKGACGSQCMLKQGETKNLAFTVNPDGSVSFP